MEMTRRYLLQLLGAFSHTLALLAGKPPIILDEDEPSDEIDRIMLDMSEECSLEHFLAGEKFYKRLVNNEPITVSDRCFRIPRFEETG